VHFKIIRNELLFKMADNKEAVIGISEILASNYNKLPDELLRKLEDREKARRHQRKS
jgi:hypothetical protein